MKKFNPERDVPTTDDEVIAALKWGKDQQIANILISIFRVRRKMGDELLVAYETALRAYLEAAGMEG